jgi:hypothetical protein
MHLNKIANYFFERIWNHTFIYFTYWTLLIQGLYYIGVLKRFQESVLLLTITVSIIGAVITYIYPQKIITPKLNIHIADTDMQLVDLFAHQIPLILLLLLYDPKIKPDNLLFAVSVFLIYILIYNPINVYNFKCDKTLAINKNNLTKCEKNKNSVTNKLIMDNRYRYHVATGIVLLYFVIIFLAITTGIFK